MKINFNLEKFLSLQEELKNLKIYLKAEGLSFRNSNDYKRINMAISRIKKKMDQASLEVAESYIISKNIQKSIPNNVQENIQESIPNNIPAVPKERPGFSSLNFISQWELAPVLLPEL